MGIPGPTGPAGPAGTYTAGTGIGISGDVLSATNTAAIWHAGSILSRPISSTTLEDGMVLAYDAVFNDWYPVLPDGGGASLWSESGSDVFYDTGNVGINGAPTARLHIFQQGQTVGTGLRFTDGTANSDWNITHGFGLRFHYGGDIRGFINASTGAYTQSSDQSLKTNIASFPNVMSRVKALQVKTYSYKSDPTSEMTIGLLAQEAKALFPELVSYSAADGLYGVNYAGFSMVAIKALQEQQATIDAQTQKIADLEARLTRLEALLKE
jgi:hypothetical protein